MPLKDIEARRAYERKRSKDPKRLDYLRKIDHTRNTTNPRRIAYSRGQSKQRSYANILRRFGITNSQYDALVTECGNLCSICRQASHKKRLAIDHDHVTGRIRGLLCQRCNLAIGQFGDNSDLCRKAADYIEKYKS